jgi:transcriptional regulator with XRE-family HTH domain
LKKFRSVKKSVRTSEQKTAPAVSGEDAASEALTLGRKLAARREAEGISLEEAAKTLHLRPTLLRELEADDLRSFTHASYARLTILGYARFLRLPESEVRPWLPEIGELATEPHQYLDRYSEAQPAARRIDYVENRNPPKNPLIGLLKLFLVLVVLLLVGYGWIIYINLGRIQPTGATPAPLPPEVEMVGTEPIIESLNVPSPLLDQDSLALDLLNPDGGIGAPSGAALLESDEPVRLQDPSGLADEEETFSLESAPVAEAEEGTPQVGGEAPTILPALPALPALPVEEEAATPITGETGNESTP